MAPAVNRLLPPASSSGARSSTSTETPCSAAASAAHRAALPPPTITTSAAAGSMLFQLLVRIDREDYTRPAAHIQERSRGHAAVVPAVRKCDPPRRMPAMPKREMAMYARVTSFKVDPARLQELAAKIEEMGPRAKAL